MKQTAIIKTAVFFLVVVLIFSAGGGSFGTVMDHSGLEENDKDLNEELEQFDLVMNRSEEEGYINENELFQATPISDWHCLDAVRNDLDSEYVLANDLDQGTDGYDDYNTGDGWDPIGDDGEEFTGTFDGNGYEIRDLYINRSDEDYIGLFGHVDGVVTDLGLVDADVRGENRVGGLVGRNDGMVNDSYATGNVSGDNWYVGGLVGWNDGTVENSYATGNVSGEWPVGGLVGRNDGMVENSYATGNVDGEDRVGGLVGRNLDGTVNNSYATGKVSGGDWYVGGLVGLHRGTVENSYATGDVSGTDVQVGGLVGSNSWGGTVNNSHATGDVSGVRDVGGFVGRNADTIRDSSATGNVSGVENVGGLVGSNTYTINNSYAAGDVSGNETIGGIVGDNTDTVVNSYFTGNVSGDQGVGGLVGNNLEGTVENSFYNIDEVLINGDHHVTISGLLNSQYQDWLEDKELVIGDYFSQDPMYGHYEIDDVQGIRDLLGFAHIEGYKFLLQDDIDLSMEPRLYIPYLAADFDGGGHSISNLQVDQPFSMSVGMFGFNDERSIENLKVEDANVNGHSLIGGLVGISYYGTVSNSSAIGYVDGVHRVGGLMGDNFGGTVETSYAVGNVSGDQGVGGLTGWNWGMLKNSYARVNVNGVEEIGGLVGRNYYGTVNNSYAAGDVNGISDVGGLVGIDWDDMGTVKNSFWDVETTGQSESDGGTGKSTAGMKSVATYTNTGVGGLDYPWDFVDDPYDDDGEEDIWNIDDYEVINDGYPFLSWDEIRSVDIELSKSEDADDWNFISFDLIPVDPSLETILENEEYGITGSYEKVMYYDASADQWMSYMPGREDHFNDLDTWDHTMGIWIQMDQNDTLTIEGDIPSSTEIVLEPGWNMVGYPSGANEFADETLPEEISKIGLFSEEAEYNIEYLSRSVFDSIVIQPGRGYWVFNEAEIPVTWTVGY